MATCTFWDMARVGEVTVQSRKSFSPLYHPTRSCATQGHDKKGIPYVQIDLPETIGRGKHSIWLTQQGQLCPMAALRNMDKITPALAGHPLFCWRDRKGNVRPLVRKEAMERVSEILEKKTWKSEFGYSFRAGGAAHYLAKGRDPEVIKKAGRFGPLGSWRRVVASSSTAGGSGEWLLLAGITQPHPSHVHFP